MLHQLPSPLSLRRQHFCRHVEILTLLFSDAAPTGDVELASLRQPNQREQDLLQARATRALTGALSAEVGRVVQETFGVDSFQITPFLTDPYQQSSRLSVNPAARVTIGKRISDRVYLTYARSLSSSAIDEIILLDQVKEMATLIPNGRLAVFKDASHFALWQDPDSFNKALVEFLTSP